MALMQNGQGFSRLSTWQWFYAIDMAIACLISYLIMTRLLSLSPVVASADRLLGGMWATIATIFVFQPTRAKAITAALNRLTATCVSFALCLVYLLLLPPGPVALAVLIGLGALIMMLARRPEDIGVTGITTTVVIVAAALGPAHEAWHQPLFRLADTIVGIAVGVACKWFASFLFYRIAGEHPQ